MKVDKHVERSYLAMLGRVYAGRGNDTMRDCFFAGAWFALKGTVLNLDPGQRITAREIERVAEIMDELTRWENTKKAAAMDGRPN